MEKLMITVAPTGAGTTREHTPYVPLTPKEIADSVYECWKAGAAIAHIHVRDEHGKPSADLNIYREVVDRIRDKCDIVLNLTTAIKGVTDEERLAVCELRPELASFDAGSMNFGYGPNVFMNTFTFLEKLAVKMDECGVKPEIEVFDGAMINNALLIAKRANIKTPMYFQFVLGIPGGLQPSTKNLLFLSESIPQGSVWSAIGAGKDQLHVNTMSIVMGGHVRVGMEDAVYYRKGELATSNAQFVDRIVQLSQILGRETATPDDARRILGVTKETI